MLERLCQWLHDLPVSATVRESLWVFPTLECIHIYSMILLITLLASFDLRLAGVTLSRHSHRTTSEISKIVLRWVWIFLLVNFVTGGLLFLSKAPDYYVNSAFLIKMLLILTGAIYQFALLRLAPKWDDVPSMPMTVRMAGALALLFWAGVIAASRWIAFV